MILNIFKEVLCSILNMICSKNDHFIRKVIYLKIKGSYTSTIKSVLFQASSTGYL